ncbi:DoxX family protein [Sphingomonas bacterium]|uniref:DoxX family protein n=1 Tax=Sphingomonas bacterium TaxID=1895847 RepID=UPI001575323C|nr:DoxX family protein [Sphingomonas bacterium]
MSDAIPPVTLADRPVGTPRLVIPALATFYAAAEPLGYLLLRVGLGAILLTHGAPKLLGTAHGVMADPYAKTAELVRAKLALPLPFVFADLVTGLETIGAACLTLGLFTRLVAPMIAVEMALICIVFWPTWVWLDRGMEYAFLMGLVALYMALRGGGRYSVDRLIGREL